MFAIVDSGYVFDGCIVCSIAFLFISFFHHFNFNLNLNLFFIAATLVPDTAWNRSIILYNSFIFKFCHYYYYYHYYHYY